MRTITISHEEESEFLTAVGRDSKWGQRLLGSTSFLVVNSGGCPSTSFPHYIGTGVNDKWHSPLYYDHDQSFLGKRVKVVRGDSEVSKPVCLGQIGTITGWRDFASHDSSQYPVILPASCYHMAIVSGDNGETFYANTMWCDVLS